MVKRLTAIINHKTMRADHTLYVNMYISNQADISLEDENMKVKVKSDLINTGHVELLLEPEREGGKHSLALRVPDYVTNYTAGEQKCSSMDAKLKAMPYHCWSNRRPGEMIVWMREFM